MNSKKIPLNKYHFVYFKIRVQYWIDYFGLREWLCSFEFEDNDEMHARVWYDLESYTCKFYLAKNFNDSIDEKLETYIDKCAFHEVFHLLLSEFSSLASKRYCTQSQLDAAEEKFVRKMENLVWNKLV